MPLSRPIRTRDRFTMNSAVVQLIQNQIHNQSRKYLITPGILPVITSKPDSASLCSSSAKPAGLHDVTVAPLAIFFLDVQAESQRYCQWAGLWLLHLYLIVVFVSISLFYFISYCSIFTTSELLIAHLGGPLRHHDHLYCFIVRSLP